jgi:hypothetical protein
MAVTISGLDGISSTVVGRSDGSATTPTLQGTDTNTGVFFPAADTIAMSTNGTERWRLNSSGNLGVGTSNPVARFQVAGNGDAFIQTGASASAANNYHFGANYSGSFILYQGNYGAGTPRFTVDTNGKVGIGTTSPSSKLQVYNPSYSTFIGTSLGAMIVTDTNATINYYSSIDFNTNSNASLPLARIGMQYTSGGSYLNFGTSSNYASGITINAMTINPQGVVDLYGGAGGASLRLRNGGDLIIYNANETKAAYIWCDPPATGMADAEYVHFERWNSAAQRCGYDRNWDNYPSITVRNDTTNGPQGEFRLHGGLGISGGDFSVVVRSDGGYLTGSDARRKRDIESIDNALGIINQLDGKKFNIINKNGQLDPMRGDKKQFGLIAQECIGVIPEAVKFYEEANTPNENGWASAYSIEYDKLTAVLINAVKELSAKNDQLEARIAALESGA